MKQPIRNLTAIRNEIVRLTANIEEVEKGDLFSEDDQAILLPRYGAHLERLQKEEELFRIPVIDPQVITN